MAQAIEKSQAIYKKIEKQLETLKEVAQNFLKHSKKNPTNWSIINDLTFIKEKIDDLMELQSFYFFPDENDPESGCEDCLGPDEVDCKIGYTCLTNSDPLSKSFSRDSMSSLLK